MELNYSFLEKYKFLENFNLKIADIDSFEDLLTLLELYRENFDYQPTLKPIIESYTNYSL